MNSQAKTPSDPQPTLSLVTKIRVTNWARDVVLECLDDPLTRRTFELVYTNCREIRWSRDETGGAPDSTEADIIGFHRGRVRFLDPALITTDLFELSILYDRFEIRELAGVSAQEKRDLVAAS